MGLTKSAMKGVPATMQNAATTGNGTAFAIPQSFTHHTFYIKANGVVGAGAVQIEAADDPEYTGTWAAQGGGPTTVVSSAELMVTLTGIFKALRARITTNITTTSVTVTYVGSN